MSVRNSPVIVLDQQRMNLPRGNDEWKGGERSEPSLERCVTDVPDEWS